MIEYPLGVDGVLTRVIETTGAGPHLVLVHGVGARADRWQRNIEPLADAGFHVSALDLPGHGFAAKGAGFDYSIAGWSRFLEGFLDHQGIDHVVLVGTSLGGHVSAELACRAPERVEALVLVGSIGLVPWGEERRHASRERLRDTSLEGIARKLRLVLHDPDLVDDDWIEEEYRINNSPGAAESFAAVAEYFAERLDDDIVGERLGTLDDGPPVMLVWGAEERAVPVEVGEQAHAMIPGSELRLIADAAHAPYYEQPEAFNDLIVEFLRQHTSAGDV